MTTIESTYLSVTIPLDSNAGNLFISRKDMPQDILDFRTCEGVLDGNKDFGLFKMRLKESDWIIDGKNLSYCWHYPSGILVSFSAIVEEDSLALNYTVNNNSEHDLNRVQIHPCIPTTTAPSFFPSKDHYPPDYQPQYFDRRGPAMVPCKSTYFKLLDRVSVYNGGVPLPLGKTTGGTSEVHLSIMRKEEVPVEWAWWNNVQETFDEPFLTVSSKDYSYTLALAFESSIWASSNVGDDRACFHLFPHFGSISRGGSFTVKGKFYYVAGLASDVFQRYRQDFVIF